MAENGGAIASVTGQSAAELNLKMQQPTQRRVAKRDVGALNISSSAFSGNAAEVSGGAIQVATGTINIINCEFVDNSVNRGGGGAIGIATHGTVIVNGCTMTNNSATNFGGAFGGNGKATISNSVLKENKAKHGGGVACYNTVTVVDTVFQENSAEYGGAIVCTGGEMQIRECTLRGNSAKQNGGAIYNYATFETYNCSLSDNSAVVGGGGIDHAGNNELRMVNSTLSGNKAGVRGGGLLVSAGKSILTHVTLADNSAQYGGGIFTGRGKVDLINSIVARSIGGDCVGELNRNVKNLIEDGSGKPSLTGDPMLEPLTGSPAFHPLRNGSPAIDAAHPDFHEPIDQRGIPRPQGEGSDIGAYEYVPDS